MPCKVYQDVKGQAQGLKSKIKAGLPQGLGQKNGLKANGKD